MFVARIRSRGICFLPGFSLPHNGKTPENYEIFILKNACLWYDIMENSLLP